LHHLWKEYNRQLTISCQGMKSFCEKIIIFVIWSLPWIEMRNQYVDHLKITSLSSLNKKRIDGNCLKFFWTYRDEYFIWGLSQPFFYPKERESDSRWGFVIFCKIIEGDILLSLWWVKFQSRYWVEIYHVICG
jgi:hypothetical protein